MSITQVAERAGVSVTTVSRVLNGSSYVAAETALRIRTCMQELGYAPRALRPGPKRTARRGVRHGNVLLLSMSQHSAVDLFRMPIFPALIGGMQETITRAGLNLLLAHCPNGITVPPSLAGNKVDGVLVIGQVMNSRGKPLGSRLLDCLGRRPVVWTYRDHNDPEHLFDHVLYDNQAVGGQAAEYFAQRGHDSVALLNAVPDHLAYLERREQFALRARALGLTVDICEPPEPLRGPDAITFVEAAITGLGATPGLATGVFCVSDDLLLTAHHTLRHANPRGRRLELLGCNNDSAFMSQMRPRPATIDIQLEQVGRQAAELLCQRLGESERRASIEILLKPVVIPGENDPARLS